MCIADDDLTTRYDSDVTDRCSDIHVAIPYNSASYFEDNNQKPCPELSSPSRSNSEYNIRIFILLLPTSFALLYVRTRSIGITHSDVVRIYNTNPKPFSVCSAFCWLKSRPSVLPEQQVSPFIRFIWSSRISKPSLHL